MRLSICAFGAAGLLLTSVASADILFNNGPMITHPDAGPGGVDVSMASVVPNSGGSNTTATIWRADDFAVSGDGWNVSTINMFAYDTSNPTPRWSTAQIQIRSGAANGTVVGSAVPTWGLAGINRTFNGGTTDTARQLSMLSADFGGLELDPGTYFAVLTITSSAGANNWVPYVMDINPNNANDPITRVGNSLVSTDSGANWTAGVVTTGGWNQSPELPFVVNGTLIPEPASAMAVLGLGVLLLRRRK
jgi:hypothetical protein